MATTPGRRAIVIGGSVGGLFAANLLHRRGWDVRVYDRVPGSLELRGTGIAHHPETEAILARAGSRTSTRRASGWRAGSRSGRTAASSPASPTRNTSPPGAASSTRCASPSRPNDADGYGVARLEQDADQVTAHFADGSSATAELLVGADGFRSAVRAVVAPEVVPIYCGYVGWRGLVEESAFSPAFAPVFAQFTFLFPGHGEFIGYPIPGLNDSAEPGKRAATISSGTTRSMPARRWTTC